MTTFRVPDMTCEACIRALTNAVRDVDETAALAADLGTKRVTVISGEAPETLAKAMEDAGFTVEAA